MASHWQWKPKVVKYLATVYGSKPPEIPRGYTFRRCMMKDFEQVKKLTGSVHHDTDSLPARYQAYINDPNRLMVVAEDNKTKRLVAFTMNLTTDGGTAFAGLMARADPTVRSQGVFHALRVYGEQLILDHLPDARCLRAAPLNMHIWMDKIKQRQINMVIPTTKSYLRILGPTSMEVATQTLAKLQCSSDATSYFTEASVSDLMLLLSDGDIVRRMFPGNVLFNFGGPCGAYRNNADMLLEADKVCSIERTRKNSGEITSVTLTRVNHCNLGLALTMDYYGPPEMKHLIGHAKVILGKLSELYVRGKVQIAFVLPESADMDALVNDMEAAGFTCDLDSQEKYYIVESVWSKL